MSIVIATFSLLATPVAHAKAVVIDDHRCVKSSIMHAHQSITDYDSYSSVPGARYVLKIAGIGVIQLLKMDKSQSKFTLREARQTDGYVWVVLQPVNLKNANFYPRFLLHCASAFDSDSHFVHRCNLDQSKTHYGLQDFRSTLDVTANSPLCSAGETRLDYELVLDSSSADVNAVKTEVTRPLGPIIGPVVAALFNEESFFRGYYVNFYSSWADQLPND